MIVMKRFVLTFIFWTISLIWAVLTSLVIGFLLVYIIGFLDIFLGFIPEGPGAGYGFVFGIFGLSFFYSVVYLVPYKMLLERLGAKDSVERNINKPFKMLGVVAIIHIILLVSLVLGSTLLDKFGVYF